MQGAFLLPKEVVVVAKHLTDQQIQEFNYTSEKWKRKRKYILSRDNYKCQICKRYGKNKEATEVHHIKHVDEYPELAYENKNLISLCHACHNSQHPEKAKKVGRY